VGPEGKPSGRALAGVGIDPGTLYVSNAVMHFRFEQRGTWRASNGTRAFATLHPSWVLRQRDPRRGSRRWEDLRLLSAPRGWRRTAYARQETCTPFQKATWPRISLAASLGSG